MAPPTRAQMLAAYATLAKGGSLNTGRKNFKGRSIFQGPRGGLFVRINGRKVYRVRQ